MSNPKRILLIEDTPAIARSVQLALQGFVVTVASDLHQARSYAPFVDFDLALVDVMLPDGNGLEFCVELKLGNPILPLIIITARADEDSIVAGLTVANDYIRKPFGRRELVARINKNLGQSVAPARIIEFGDLRLHLASEEIEFAGRRFNLRPKEFAILSILVIHAGDRVSRETILRLIDRDGKLHDRSLDSHLSRIRKRLVYEGVSSVEIVTIPGEGYALKKSE